MDIASSLIYMLVGLEAKKRQEEIAEKKKESDEAAEKKKKKQRESTREEKKLSVVYTCIQLHNHKVNEDVFV